MTTNITNDQDNQPTPKRRRHGLGFWLGLCSGIGASIGVAQGELAVGLGIGMAIGLLGYSIQRWQSRQ